MAKRGLLTPAGAKVVAGLILNYTLPALLFAKMLTCVSPDNAEELGFVAMIAVFYIAMGAVFGFLIQRTKLVPKRLYWGIVAATMFTNFGDLPISIILAVSDHPPFLVGDGAQGTAYSSVFISVFYLFLFPLGGYRLIRYDHVKESKRLRNLTASLQEHECVQSSPDSSGFALSGDVIPSSPRQSPRQQNRRRFSSPGEHTQQQESGVQSSFSATSTMISMDYISEDNAKELRYRPYDQELAHSPTLHSPQDRYEGPLSSRETNPFVQNSYISSSSGRGSNNDQPLPSCPLQLLKSSETQQRYSVESIASSGTGMTRFSAGKQSQRSPLSNGYRPPLLQQPSGSSGSSNSSRSNTLAPTSTVLPSAHVSDHKPPTPEPTIAIGSTASNVAEPMAAVPLPDPLPKVPPALQNAHMSNRSKVHWFWRVFHLTREYLTPPTIGLILGLLMALTPLRALFVSTPNPLPSPDELPPLSFILEITLMLGGCCVPLGLTVLGASLSRLKPGRMRPLVPALTMITVVKLVVMPLIGIVTVQMLLVKQWRWVSAENHMLQFTLMLMSGSPTSITCFVLAQVWDRRTNNAGAEMAALIAVQYAAATVVLTVECAFMMYFLF
ncbi:auxin efflux carrier [Gamsiella multidivaricata]|uniref:auxin efflux carrier n=1 Tax=Gamsiella multidivaricata TaxID=101098 RepID=UPI00221F248F|nr:auxin efflux carrier [Gamsiella multidivaricata]KAG0365778.1 hypothetical protein BGZ54_006208 [Gamsiella multidivaricata]KAI7818330.1 auxin efflux carrier [Gamsiella multidivaricata]